MVADLTKISDQDFSFCDSVKFKNFISIFHLIITCMINIDNVLLALLMVAEVFRCKLIRSHWEWSVQKFYPNLWHFK